MFKHRLLYKKMNSINKLSNILFLKLRENNKTQKYLPNLLINQKTVKLYINILKNIKN